MTAAIKLQTIALWEQAKAFLATPIGWISVVLGLGAAITAATDAWQKNVEVSQEALKTNEENIQQYQSELDSLEQLQKKLKEAQGDKKALAAIQGELNDAIGETVGLLNGEAEAYKTATINLQAQINAKKKLIEQEQQEAVNNNKTIFNNQGIKKSFLGIDWLAPDSSGDKLREAAKEISKRQDKYGMDYDDAFNSIARNYGVTREEWDKYWNEQVSTAYSVFQQTIDNYDGFGGSTFIQKVIEGGVREGKSLDEVQKMLNEISSNDIQPLVNEYIASLDNPDVDSESLYNNIVKKLDELKEKYPELTTLIDGYSKDLVNNINNVSSSFNGAANSTLSLSEAYEKLKEKVDPLAKAYEEMTESGELSADTLFNLLKSHKDLIKYIEIENGQYKIKKSLLEDEFKYQRKLRIEELERAKLNILHSNSREGKMGPFQFSPNALKEDLEVLERYSKEIEILKNLDIDDFSGGSKKSPIEENKEAAEKYFAELKYKLETNKITQEEYLKTLDKKYKEYYNKTADYLEDYAKYSQEVYDGFKDMYKEDLEAQKEAWEEKKDAVSEYYDNLREQIENTHDEEDYEKEQSEKRKEIFDLNMQIAELMRDGSEKAKARIAELEEERLKAEEELLDFETDKAREDELSRLEKEQEAEEKKIQGQIDGIQGQLDQLDKDTVSVRNAIITYAKEKGVTLNFAYATGTRSSVGGFGRINEKGIEMISAPDGNGNYIPMLPNSYVFSAKATEFLWKLATEHSLPQAMYNSIAKSIKTQSSTPSVNIAQPITITMGDVIIKGNADKQTVADIKKQQENTVRMVLQKIKELQK